MHEFTNNRELMITAGPGDVIPIDGKELPPILTEAGAETWQHFVEYFTAQIRNSNTRECRRAGKDRTNGQPHLNPHDTTR